MKEVNIFWDEKILVYLLNKVYVLFNGFILVIYYMVIIWVNNDNVINNIFI